MEHSYSPKWQTPNEPEAGLERTDRTRDGESAAGARAHALAADLAAARVTLQTERRRSKDLEAALAERSGTLTIVRSTVEELLREAERHKSELRTLRESLAARDAQLSALQQEHAKAAPALDATSGSTAQREAELRASRTEAGALASELKSSRETVAALTAQISRSESEVNAARAEVNAANSRACTYLELLRTHEWRRGFDQNMFRDLDAPVGAASTGHPALESECDRLRGQLAEVDSERLRWTAELATRDRALVRAQERATSDAQRFAELKEAADLRQAEHAAQVAQLRAEQAAQIERLQAEADQREEEMGVLLVHLQEARRTIQAFEADLKRLSEERDSGIDRSTPVSGAAAAAAGADAVAAASGSRSAELVRIDGDAATTHVLARSTRIGRAADCELQVHSRAVSRYHALVIVGPRDTVIEDLNSTNGVLVNGRLMTRHVLADGDELTIGETRFRYVARLHGAATGPNPAGSAAPRGGLGPNPPTGPGSASA